MTQTRIVYIDVLFFTNFIINCAMILCTARLLSQKVSHGRTAAAAALGGAYSVCIFFPVFSMAEWVGLKLLFAVSIAAAAFGFKGMGRLIKCTAAFLAVSFMFGGAAFALFFLTPLNRAERVIENNGVFYPRLSLPVLLAACAVSYILLNYALYVFRRHACIRGSVIDVRLSMGQKSCMLRAICDSGNLLKTPSEQKPVLICELSALSDMLEEDDMAALSDIENRVPSFGVIFLPYTSLGTKNALIPAFFIDEATYYIKREEIKREKVPIAVSRESLSSDGSINALVNPDAFLKGYPEA